MWKNLPPWSPGTTPGAEKDPAADWSILAGKQRSPGRLSRRRARFFDQALELLPPADQHRRWQALLGRDEVLGVLGDATSPPG